MSPRTLTGAEDPGGRFAAISISSNLLPSQNFQHLLLFINILYSEKIIIFHYINNFYKSCY